MLSRSNFVKILTKPRRATLAKGLAYQVAICGDALNQRFHVILWREVADSPVMQEGKFALVLGVEQYNNRLAIWPSAQVLPGPEDWDFEFDNTRAQDLDLDQ